jgi:hypothetical protein
MIGSQRMRLALVLPVLLLVVGFLLACGGSSAADTGTQVNGTVTSAPPAQHFKVGDQVKIGTWVVTLNKVSTSKGDDFDQPKGIYLILDLTFKNTSSAKQTLSSLISFTFQDGTGQKYDPQITGLSGVTPPDGDVQAGSQVRGQVVYDVSKDQHSFTFTFTPDLGGDAAATWDVSI